MQLRLRSSEAWRRARNMKYGPARRRAAEIERTERELIRLGAELELIATEYRALLKMLNDVIELDRGVWQ